MGDTRRGENAPKRGEHAMSTAVTEAFGYLQALQRREYRGWGDTATAARDRAARQAGITTAQAERLWKRWQRMASVDGDVYRALRNRYEALCAGIEASADRMRDERLQITGQANAVSESPVAMAAGMARAAKVAPEEGMR